MFEIILFLTDAIVITAAAINHSNEYASCAMVRPRLPSSCLTSRRPVIKYVVERSPLCVLARALSCLPTTVGKSHWPCNPVGPSRSISWAFPPTDAKLMRVPESASRTKTRATSCGSSLPSYLNVCSFPRHRATFPFLPRHLLPLYAFCGS